jgi:SAM-dependent methyltransferase
MRLSEKYRNQSTWRDWQSYIDYLPIIGQDIILDLGCSIGIVTKSLSKKAYQVFGIDNNPELIKEAYKSNSSENIKYILNDLKSIQNKELPLADGIWTSFVAAYFPNFIPIIIKWLGLLKPKGWIAIVEMNDLFAHEPLSMSIHDTFNEYYERQYKNNLYDFKMGGKIKDYLLKQGLSIIHEENKFDKELTFNGPAEPLISKAWENRFDRMYMFKEFVGDDNFNRIKKEFINCLSAENHMSKTIVKFIMARKNNNKT